MFDLLVIPMLPTKFQVNWPFGSGKEAKNRFSRRFSFGSGEEVKIYFQDGRHDGHLGFRIGTFLATFDLQITLRRPIKFLAIGPGCRRSKLLKPHDGRPDGRRTWTEYNS